MVISEKLNKNQKAIAALQAAQEKLIKEQNRQFGKLSKSQQRIAIAQDVIDLIKSKTITVKSGVWVENLNIDSDECAEGSVDLQKELLQDSVIDNCHCCALGACFLSRVRLGNKVDSYVVGYKGIDVSEHLEYLSNIFSEQQLEMIECAFEKGKGGLDYDSLVSYDCNEDEDDEHLMNECIAFGKKYPNDTNRLLAIMENIIKNRGEFKP